MDTCVQTDLLNRLVKARGEEILWQLPRGPQDLVCVAMTYFVISFITNLFGNVHHKAQLQTEMVRTLRPLLLFYPS